MKPHCDRCDNLCDEYPRWVEDNESLLDGTGKLMVGSGANPIWHIDIHSGGRVESCSRMFCRTCRIAILEAHATALKRVKGEGGHLADCRWSNTAKKYICADGCEIKGINKS